MRDPASAYLKTYFPSLPHPELSQVIRTAGSGRDVFCSCPPGECELALAGAGAAFGGRSSLCVYEGASAAESASAVLRSRGLRSACFYPSDNRERNEDALRAAVRRELDALFLPASALLESGIINAASDAAPELMVLFSAQRLDEASPYHLPSLFNAAELARSLPRRPVCVAVSRSGEGSVKKAVRLGFDLENPAFISVPAPTDPFDFSVRETEDPAAELLRTVSASEKSVLVMCRTTSAAEQTASFLRSRGVRAGAITYAMTPEERDAAAHLFDWDAYDALVCDRSFRGRSVCAGLGTAVVYRDCDLSDLLRAGSLLARFGSEKTLRAVFAFGDRGEGCDILRRASDTGECLNKTVFGADRPCGRCSVCSAGKSVFTEMFAKNGRRKPDFASIDPCLHELRECSAKKLDVPPKLFISDRALSELSRAVTEKNASEAKKTVIKFFSPYAQQFLAAELDEILSSL
ncbi:MAG: hypothetical protein K6C36_01160 [Clostridia bacterium]|nr:hypothetical protein [Clostridia bacterium]